MAHQHLTQVVEAVVDVDLVLPVVGVEVRVGAVDDVANCVEAVKLVEDVELDEGCVVCLGQWLRWVLEGRVHFWCQSDHAD